MPKALVYLATAIDKEIGSTTYYLMDAERFARILGEHVDGIEKTLAEIEEQTPAHIFTLVKDLIDFIQQGGLVIVEEAVGVFVNGGSAAVARAQGE